MRHFHLAAVLAALLAGPAAAEPFRLIVTDLETPLVPNSVMDLALAGGYFQRAGVEVELVRVQQTPSAVAALRSGEGEMANISTDALLLMVAGGADDLRAVASPNKSLPFLIAARPDIASVAELAGQSFGVGRVGSLDHALSMKVLAASGVDVATLEIVTLGQPNVRAQALLAGQVAATTMSIGTLTALPDPQAVKVLVDADRYYAAVPVVTKVNVVRREVLETRRPEVEAVLEALVLAARDFAADPSLWVAAMETARPDVDPAALQALAAAYAQSWSVNGGLQQGELAQTAEWLWQGEDFKDLAPVPLAAWADFGPLDAVLSRVGPSPLMDPVSR